MGNEILIAVVVAAILFGTEKTATGIVRAVHATRDAVVNVVKKLKRAKPAPARIIREIKAA